MRRKGSKLEARFKLLWLACNGTKLVAELQFHPARKWRFDFAIPALKIAFEIEGGIFTGGRHTRAYGFSNDCEKYNAATALGWRVLRLTKLQLTYEKVRALADFSRTEMQKLTT